MYKRYWIKANGEVQEISLQAYNYFHNHNINSSASSNKYMIVEVAKSHLNIMKRSFLPDISLKALKEILKDD